MNTNCIYDIATTIYFTITDIKIETSSIDFSKYFQYTADSSYTCYENFRIRWIDSKSFINTKMKNVYTDDDEKTAFRNALLSSNFSVLKPNLTTFFQGLDVETQDAYLKIITVKSLSENNPRLTERLLSLMSYEQMLVLVTKMEGETFDITNSAKDYIENIDINDKFSPYHANRVFFKSEISRLAVKVSVLVTYYFNLITSTLQSFTTAKTEKSAWDAAFRFTLLGMMFDIPKRIYKEIKVLVPHPVLNKVVFTISLLSIASFVYCYKKWIEPKPETIPYAENLTRKYQEDPSSFLVRGRETELVTVLNQLTINVESSSRVHCLIQGLPGAGKTTFIEGLTAAIANGSVSPKLQGAAVHIIHAADLLKEANSYSAKTPYDEILEVMSHHNKKIVLVIDDFHEVMQNDKLRPALLKLLQTSKSSQSFPLFIGITPVDLEKNEKTNSFFKEHGYSRRFINTKLLEMDKKNTIEIMKDVKNSKHAHIHITDENYDTIFENGQNKKNKLEPANSIEHLETILINVNNELEGQPLQNKKTGLEIRLRTQEQEISQAKRKAQTSLLIEKRKTEADINKIKEEIATLNQNVKTYDHKKNVLRDKEFALKTVAERVIASKKVGEDHLQYLFERFYLQTAMKKEAKNFAKLNHLPLMVTRQNILDHFNKKSA